MDRLDGIEVFMSVVRAGSFSAAAEILGCSKSTVSDQITRLEERIGARLLRRSSRSVTLTEAGRAYLCQIDDVLDRVSDAEKAARAETTEPRGVLRLSAPAPFAANHIAPILPEFMAKYPEIRVELNVAAEVVDLVQGGYDLAIRLCTKNSPSLIIRQLGQSRIIVVASPDFMKGRPTLKVPEDLNGYPAIAFAHYPDRELWHLKRGTETRIATVNPIMITSCPSVLLQMARSSVGIIQVCECNVVKDIRAGRLVRILPDWQFVDVPILAVYPDNKQIAVKVRAFIEFLARRIKDERLLAI